MRVRGDPFHSIPCLPASYLSPITAASLTVTWSGAGLSGEGMGRPALTSSEPQRGAPRPRGGPHEPNQGGRRTPSHSVLAPIIIPFSHHCVLLNRYGDACHDLFRTPEGRGASRHRGGPHEPNQGGRRTPSLFIPCLPPSYLSPSHHCGLLTLTVLAKQGLRGIGQGNKPPANSTRGSSFLRISKCCPAAGYSRCSHTVSFPR